MRVLVSLGTWPIFAVVWGCSTSSPTYTNVYYRPTSTPTPHAQTLAEGEEYENRLAREAEEKARQQNTVEGKVQQQADNVEQSVLKEQQKAEEAGIYHGDE